jgi:hypothetical protein
MLVCGVALYVFRVHAPLLYGKSVDDGGAVEWWADGRE